MPRYHMINDTQVQFTPEEETARDLEEAAAGDLNTRMFRNLREIRDRLLSDTDWWASSDLTITQPQKDYRQALRNLPENTADPTNVTWPTEPV